MVTAGRFRRIESDDLDDALADVQTRRNPMRRITPAALITAMTLGSAAWADDWPQWMGPNRDAVWAETRVLDRFPPGGPKVLWRAPVASGYAGPAVVGNRVFVTDFVPEKPVKREGKGGPADFK